MDRRLRSASAVPDHTVTSTPMEEAPFPREILEVELVKANQLCKTLSHGLEGIPNRHGNANYTSHLEDVDRVMKGARLAYMAIIFHDFEFALENRVELELWTAHTNLNGQFRKIIQNLEGQNQVVQKRKVEKLYREFLKTSQLFYQGYITRLCANFDVAELRRAAEGLDAGHVERSATVCVPASRLRAEILNSCYMTLVRLGDLARYRCQAAEKPKKGHVGFETAMSRYALANEIDPDDGTGHHQMAVLYQRHGQQLDIVYSFYRSISIAKPVKLASNNLKIALQAQFGVKKGSGKSPADVLITWFLKLHSVYYKGKSYTAQAELEEEVLHRLDLAMKTDGDDKSILKMILINIAACDIALADIGDNWSLEKSAKCQSLLLFSIRTVLVVLQRTLAVLRQESDNSGQSDDELKKLPENPTLSKLLPFLRIHMAWIYSFRQDFVKYQEYLEPHIRVFYNLLADTLTELLPLATVHRNTVESKYLLAEDEESLGLKPLMDRKLPLFYQIDDNADLLKRKRVLKLRRRAFGHDFDTIAENVWRIRDILCCGVYLVGSSKFPLVTVRKADGRDVVTYDGGTSGCTPLDDAGVDCMLDGYKLGSHKEVPSGHDVAGNVAQVHSVDEGVEKPKEAQQPTGPEPVNSDVQLPNPPETTIPDQPANYNLIKDQDMANMVDELLDTDDEFDKPPHQSSSDTRTRVESSYGMNTTMANDIFGQVQVHEDLGNQAPSISTKPFTNLPWDFFYVPAKPESPQFGSSVTTPCVCNVATPCVSPANNETPNRTMAREPPFYGNSNRTVAPEPPSMSTYSPPGLTKYDQETFSLNSLKGSTLPSGTEHDLSSHAAHLVSSQSPSQAAEQTCDVSDFATKQQNAAKDKLRSALMAQYGAGAASSSSPVGGLGSYNNFLEANSRPGSTNSYRNTNSRQTPTPAWANGQSPLSNRIPNANTSAVAGKSNELILEAYSKTPSHHIQSIGDRKHSNPRIPSTNSPTGALPVRQEMQGTQLMNSNYKSTTTGVGPSMGANTTNGQSNGINNQYYVPFNPSSSLAFSNPNSLWTGTPAQPRNPVAAAHRNGNHYTSSIPYGRGDEVGNYADYTQSR